jgi:hypothetical protein
LPSRDSKKKINEKKLPTIECSCGAKILLVPDIKLMSKAIEAHVEVHRCEVKNTKDAEAQAQTILDDLITKVLVKACEV